MTAAKVPATNPVSPTTCEEARTLASKQVGKDWQSKEKRSQGAFWIECSTKLGQKEVLN